MQQPKAPRRAVELMITLGADDDEALIDGLEHILFEFSSRGPRDIASGGVSMSFSSSVQRRPEQTPEKFQKELREWVKARKVVP